jgi:hypothetical protein
MGFRLGSHPSRRRTPRDDPGGAEGAGRTEGDGDTRRIEDELATFQEHEDAVGTAPLARA